jgi:hypothetical protein
MPCWLEWRASQTKRDGPIKPIGLSMGMHVEIIATDLPPINRHSEPLENV